MRFLRALAVASFLGLSLDVPRLAAQPPTPAPAPTTAAPTPQVPAGGEAAIQDYVVAGVVSLIILGVVCFPEARE